MRRSAVQANYAAHIKNSNFRRDPRILDMSARINDMLKLFRDMYISRIFFS